MESIADSLAPFVFAALVVWFVLGPLMRLTAIACFVAAAGGLAVGDASAAAGIAALGSGCALVSHLVFRARHGRWRTARVSGWRTGLQRREQHTGASQTLVLRGRAALAVLLKDVVNAADGWPVAEAAVWPPAVVVAQKR